MTMSAGEEHLPQPGEVLAGKYRIERIIGKGGMGAVLAAHHQLLGETVAIKFLLGEIAQNPEAVKRFHNEARNAFKIKSEHVCRVMDVGEERGMPFMVMEFLNGEDLSQMLEKRGALPVEEAVDYVLQALEAIAQAHAFGMVHRDLKPANLFLHRSSDGSSLIKVLDFGIAKSNTFGDASGQHNLTSTKSMLGSPLYMSPEQLRSAKNVDARSDIWALGVILYELLTGTVPFNGETLGELFIAILEQPPAPVSSKRSDVPQMLSDAVMRCLQRQVEHRFANVAELAQMLAPCAPARSFVSVERVSQALGLPKPSGVMPMAGSMPDPRGPMPSYGGAQPAAFSSSQSGPYPQGQQPNKMSSSYSGSHQLSPQGGTQLLGAQTNSSWGNTGGVAPAPKSNAGLFIGLGAGALVLLAALGGGIYALTHHTAATSPTPTATATATETATVTATATATATTNATIATTATAPQPSATQAAPSASVAEVHTASTHTGTHTHATATTAATHAPPPPATTTAKTAGTFDPLHIDRRP